MAVCVCVCVCVCARYFCAFQGITDNANITSQYNNILYVVLCLYKNFNADADGDPMINIGVLSPIDEPPGQRSVMFDSCSFRNNPSNSRARLISATDEKDHIYDLTVQNTVFESSFADVATIGVDGSSGLITVTDTVFRCGGQFSVSSRSCFIYLIKTSCHFQFTCHGVESEGRSLSLSIYLSYSLSIYLSYTHMF